MMVACPVSSISRRRGAIGIRGVENGSSRRSGYCSSGSRGSDLLREGVDFSDRMSGIDAVEPMCVGVPIAWTSQSAVRRSTVLSDMSRYRNAFALEFGQSLRSG